MARTTIELDDAACAAVMRRYRLATREEAVNLALRQLALDSLSRDEAVASHGIGWEGDLDAMRGDR